MSSPLLSDRESTHGSFERTARITQALKAAMRISKNHPHLPPIMAEALDMISSKMARVLSGDPTHADHWDDIAGYATLVADHLRSSGTTSSGSKL